MVDHIMFQSSLAFLMRAFKIHIHQPLNLSDYLLVSLTIQTCTDSGASNQPDSTPNFNWPRAVERGDVLLYGRTISSVVSSLPSNSCQSVTELNDEISHICQILRKISHEYLPILSNKKKKNIIKDHELKSLCKQSKKAWECCKKAGKPPNNPLAKTKRASKLGVRQFVSRSRARIERFKNATECLKSTILYDLRLPNTIPHAKTAC